MKTMMEDYAAFELAMDRDGMFRDMDFYGICTEIGADRDSLDRMIKAELGFSGQELVDFYQSKFC